jgi:DNA-binding PadR family transcriptional regulator
MTDSELAILSLVAEKPRHGYEIEQVIEEREMRNWTAVGFSSIYYVLKKLEKRGLIEGQTREPPGQGPPRKVYHLTSAGEAAFREAVMEALSTPASPHSSFLLGLSNLPGLEPHQVLSALLSYRRKLTERGDHLRVRWASFQGNLPLHVNALFDYGMTMIEAELTWITDYIHRLEQNHEQNRP